ncbi:MAG: hypothetical protein ABI402_21165 [Ferruginibacter sp.]
MWKGSPYYESKKIKIIFQANCINGSIQGTGTLSVADSNRLISTCYFENSEITGETLTRGIYSDNIYKRNYKNGDFRLVSQTETDKDGNKIVAVDNNEKFSFKETYLTLLDPFRYLDPKEKGKQVYINNTSPDFQNPLLLQPVDLILYYFSHITMQEPLKKYNTNNFEVTEFGYDDLKIVFYSFNKRVRAKNPLVIECYDKRGRLIIVRYSNVHFDEIKNLDDPAYMNFYQINGYGDVMTVFMYDDKGNIIKASKYGGIYENDINAMCDYDSDGFMKLLLTHPDVKPISILNHKQVKVSGSED